MSQQGYSRRVKNIGAQLNKKMNNFVEAVVATPSAGVEGYSEVMLNAMEVTPTLGLSFGGEEKRLNDIFLVIEEDWYCEDGVATSNTKGKRELKNLECSINFEARGSGYSRGKGKVACKFMIDRVFFGFQGSVLRTQGNLGFRALF
jgi:hypothetical protein